jgi:ABC-type Mn2+/Zn2+ transport system ATPase subunit
MTTAPRQGEPILSADGLAAGYGAEIVLSGVSFAVAAGEAVAVVGPNGGGKTTLFRVLTGELVPAAGDLVAPARIGFVPQTERSRLDFPVSALDVALMGAISSLPWWRRPGARERARARAALEEVGLADRADATFGDLSGGQRQRVLVARALVQDAPLMLLDEPFSGLDTVSAERLEQLLAEMAGRGRALLIATHDMQQTRRWDQVLCLNREQVAFGPPADVLDVETVRRTYGQEVVELPGFSDVIVPGHTASRRK